MSAPILKHPDPSRPFIMKVDTSETGVRQSGHRRMERNLSFKQLLSSQKKLSPTVRNYDISNREVLAVKLALEEWRHWLEVAQHLFVIYTDHNNLEYFKTQLTTSKVGPVFCKVHVHPLLPLRIQEYKSWLPLTPIPSPSQQKQWRAYLAANRFFRGSNLGVWQGDWEHPRTENPQSVNTVKTFVLPQRANSSPGHTPCLPLDTQVLTKPTNLHRGSIGGPTWTFGCWRASLHLLLVHSPRYPERYPLVNSFRSPNHTNHALT